MGKIAVVEPVSLVGRIHDMISDMQKQGRMSCAEVACVWALTMHPDLPAHFRENGSSPTWPSPYEGGHGNVPAARPA